MPSDSEDDASSVFSDGGVSDSTASRVSVKSLTKKITKIKIENAEESEDESEDDEYIDNIDYNTDDNKSYKSEESILPEDCIYATEEVEPEEIIDHLRVPNSERISKPILTKFEFIRVLEERVNLLSKGAPRGIIFEGKMPDLKRIAYEELQQNRIPFIIKRPMPDGRYELWHLKELKKVDNGYPF